MKHLYQGADKSLARPGKKQAQKHVRDARDFNNILMRAVSCFVPPPLQGKAPKEIHAILTETLACFLADRAKDLSGPPYIHVTSLALVPLQCHHTLQWNEHHSNDRFV